VDVAVRHDQREIARLGATRGSDGRSLLGAHGLDDRATHLGGRVRGQRDPDHALGASLLGDLGELVDLLAGGRGHARRRDAHDAPTGRACLLEHHEPGARDRVGEVVDLHAVAQVRLIDAVAVDRLTPGQAREGDLLDGALGRH
jgi:hypothetical protein